jgi:cell division protein FtsX
MNNLGGFLDKFKNIFQGVKFEKDAVISIINTIAKIHLDEKDFEVKNFVVKLTASPGVKSVVYMHKQKILEELKVQLGDKAPIDIR